MTDTYQGWTNRETWCVSLWLNNDSEGLYRAAREIARKGEPHQSAEALEAFTEELIDASGFASDLISCAMIRVNWREVVADLREE